MSYDKTTEPSEGNQSRQQTATFRSPMDNLSYGESFICYILWENTHCRENASCWLHFELQHFVLKAGEKIVDMISANLITDFPIRVLLIGYNSHI
jgi:hypothetical protein